MTIQQKLASHYSIPEEEISDILRSLAIEVNYWVRRANGYLDRDEATSESYLALVEAIQTYDESKGSTLKHYAKLKTRWAIVSHLRSFPKAKEEIERDADITYPDTAEDYYRLHEALEALKKHDELEAEIITRMVLGERRDTIAEELGVTERQLNRILRKYRSIIQR